jgi:ABC-type transport system involved in multi-copper enzyme maturation permease subunit
VLRPPNSSVILVRGHTSSFPAAWDFGPAGIEVQPPYPNRETANYAGVLLDLEGVVLVFGGLVGLVLGVGRVLMDRDSGWDAAVRALPLPGALIAASRVVSGGLVMVVLVVVWFGVIAAVAGVFAANVAENLRVTLAYLSPSGLRRSVGAAIQ